MGMGAYGPAPAGKLVIGSCRKVIYSRDHVTLGATGYEWLLPLVIVSLCPDQFSTILGDCP